MATQIPLSALPKQSLNITFDNVAYVIEIGVLPSGNMCANITRNGALLVSGARCISSYPILRYKYLQSTFGNFLWDTPDDELPDWQKFGVSHFLYYVPASEMVAA